MNRLLSVFLSLALVFSLSSCAAQTTPPQSPVSFYYLVSDSEKTTPDSMIQPEIRESAGYENNQDKLIDLYLKGPVDPRFSTPFPKDTILISSRWRYDTLYLRLSNRISRLSGIDLFVACACLTLTAAEITGAKRVVISSESGEIDGLESITMVADSINLADLSANYPSESPTQPSANPSDPINTEP